RVCASSGSACTSGTIRPSHVLLAMGREADVAKASVRFSIGSSNTIAEIERAADALRLVYDRVVGEETRVG
ncbi:MAG: cysteine desulfurase NifS, partial [Rhodothermia bacterium]|nr:cysteine desulfurase NifS [Rhodothermia bacterium]